MIGRGKAGLLLPVLFVAAAGVAAWGTYSWLQTPVNATQAVGDIAAESSEIAALSEELEFTMPPIGAYDAILKRPIFAPNRRAVAGVSKSPIVNQELGVELLGIVGDESDMRILLKPTDGGETANLRVGEDFRGWTFTGIEDSSAKFENDGGDVESLELDYEKAPKVTVQSRRDKRRKQAQQAQKNRQRQQAGANVQQEPVEEEEEQGDDEQ